MKIHIQNVTCDRSEINALKINFDFQGRRGKKCLLIQPYFCQMKSFKIDLKKTHDYEGNVSMQLSSFM